MTSSATAPPTTAPPSTPAPAPTAAPAPRPLYVDRRSEQAYAPPLKYQNTTLYGFLIPADLDCLQRLCAKFINTPSGGQLSYEPVAPVVVLFFSLVRSWSAAGSPSGGTIELREAGFWIPVDGTHPGPDGGMHVGLYPYYVFSDNGLVRATGREVFGAPIDYCSLDMPQGTGGVAAFHLNVNVISYFEPTTRAQMELLLRVVPVGGSDGNAQTWATAGYAAQGVPSMIDSPSGGGEEGIEEGIDEGIDMGIRARRPRPMPAPSLPTISAIDVVSLKQFRTAHRADLACYQSVVISHLKLDGYRAGGQMPGIYELNIQEVDSHPIVQEMGLQTSAFSSLQGFWADVDYTVERGTEVRAP